MAARIMLSRAIRADRAHPGRRWALVSVVVVRFDRFDGPLADFDHV